VVWCGTNKKDGGVVTREIHLGLFAGREGKYQGDYSILVLSEALCESNRRIAYLRSAGRMPEGSVRNRPVRPSSGEDGTDYGA